MVVVVGVAEQWDVRVVVVAGKEALSNDCGLSDGRVWL